MLAVLVDSSVLLDLVLCYQKKHRRNRSVASSAAAAIECLLFYDEPVVESPSSFGLLQQAEATRYLDFYCDEPNSAVEQLQDLLQICKPIEVSQDMQTKCYEQSLACLNRNLERVPDPDDLRAYEMYDFLPYHLGEDPTSIECQINATSASDLHELVNDVPNHFRIIIERLGNILKDRLHPVRAAWALPLLRLLYYQMLQQAKENHFVPHVTKSTIGFGRESQTIRSKRLLDYCTQSTRECFVERVQTTFDNQPLNLTLPNIAETVLARCTEWRQLIDMINRLRDSQQLQHMRSTLAVSFGGRQIEAQPDELANLATDIHRSLEIKLEPRQITVSLPFFTLDDSHLTNQNSGSSISSMVFIHQLYQAG